MFPGKETNKRSYLYICVFFYSHAPELHEKAHSKTYHTVAGVNDTEHRNEYQTELKTYTQPEWIMSFQKKKKKIITY